MTLFNLLCTRFGICFGIFSFSTTRRHKVLVSFPFRFINCSRYCDRLRSFSHLYIDILFHFYVVFLIIKYIYARGYTAHQVQLDKPKTLFPVYLENVQQRIWQIAATGTYPQTGVRNCDTFEFGCFPHS